MVDNPFRERERTVLQVLGTTNGPSLSRIIFTILGGRRKEEGGRRNDKRYRKKEEEIRGRKKRERTKERQGIE
jgi:hypothetical protein